MQMPFQYSLHILHKDGRLEHKEFLSDENSDPRDTLIVQNGGDAMDIFANLHLLKDQSERKVIRQDLLDYCRLDTLAMVRIWEKLHKIVSNI